MPNDALKPLWLCSVTLQMVEIIQRKREKLGTGAQRPRSLRPLLHVACKTNLSEGFTSELQIEESEAKAWPTKLMQCDSK